tara:strand:- start:76 stop:180 length:105 start_codon:yes stop_codon:yes gene_type:complete
MPPFRAFEGAERPLKAFRRQNHTDFTILRALKNG